MTGTRQSRFRGLAVVALAGMAIPAVMDALVADSPPAPRYCSSVGKPSCDACGVDGLLIAALEAAEAPPEKPAPEPMEVVIADFEGSDWGAWKVEGSAFGKGPARGTLPGQMAVSGFEGKGLVNSYVGGDSATGRLLSPRFRIERHYINFLVGGGKHPGETCVNLLVDGLLVHTTTGPNDRSGGSEQLDWQTWDTLGYMGRTAQIEIVDRHTGGWGHINVDQIVQSVRRRQSEPARRELAVDHRYLLLPVKTGARMRRVRVVSEAKTIREFDIELADAAPDFLAFADLAGIEGKSIVIEVDALPADSKGLAAIETTSAPVDPAENYRESDRPQFHFTSRRGWLNDPNGLVFHDGEYHLFYQHNPFGWNWGNMHWGHAVSRDLVHWHELSDALLPRQYGDWAFSGSAVVDARNTSGLGKGGNGPLVIAYTSTGRGECIAYSNDRGRTWSEYAGNPVVKHAGRDPKLIWHTPSGRWVMAVYDEHEQKRWIAFYTSADLKQWEFASRIGDFFECPDLFELPVSDSPETKRWVLYGADGKYLLGTFDGRNFVPESPEKQQLWYGNFYAAQTFSDTPDGRRIQVGWGSGITFPGMPFNQQMTVPCRLSLRETTDGLRMFAEPVVELAALRETADVLENLRFEADRATCLLLKFNDEGQSFELAMEFENAGAQSIEVLLRGISVVYDFAKQELVCQNIRAPLTAEKGVVRLRALVDRGSIEVFGNEGRVALSAGARPDPKTCVLEQRVKGAGAVMLKRLAAHRFRSAWKPSYE